MTVHTIVAKDRHAFVAEFALTACVAWGAAARNQTEEGRAFVQCGASRGLAAAEAWTAWMPPTATRPHGVPGEIGLPDGRARYPDGAHHYSTVHSDHLRLVAP